MGESSPRLEFGGLVALILQSIAKCWYCIFCFVFGLGWYWVRRWSSGGDWKSFPISPVLFQITWCRFLMSRAGGITFTFILVSTFSQVSLFLNLTLAWCLLPFGFTFTSLCHLHRLHFGLCRSIIVPSMLVIAALPVSRLVISRCLSNRLLPSHSPSPQHQNLTSLGREPYTANLSRTLSSLYFFNRRVLLRTTA